MGTVPNIRELPSAARIRILLICPDCGQENVEFADRLRGARAYFCAGEGCDYRFDRVGGSPKGFVQGMASAWRRIYAALTPAN